MKPAILVISYEGKEDFSEIYYVKSIYAALFKNVFCVQEQEPSFSIRLFIKPYN